MNNYDCRGAIHLYRKNDDNFFYKKEQQDLIYQPNDTGQVCKRLDSRISNNEFIISSGKLLVTPEISFNIIIIIIIILFNSKNIIPERVVPFYFPLFKWKGPLYVIPNSFDLLNVSYFHTQCFGWQFLYLFCIYSLRSCSSSIIDRAEVPR